MSKQNLILGKMVPDSKQSTGVEYIKELHTSVPVPAKTTTTPSSNTSKVNGGSLIISKASSASQSPVKGSSSSTYTKTSSLASLSLCKESMSETATLTKVEVFVPGENDAEPLVSRRKRKSSEMSCKSIAKIRVSPNLKR